MRAKRAQGAFTLIELLIVIAIIGILAAVLVTTFTHIGESAHGARCKANLRNLAQGCFSYANSNGGIIPPAESYDILLPPSLMTRRTKLTYSTVPGWVHWTGRDGDSSSCGAGASKSTCYAQSDNYNEDDPAFESLRKGMLWDYVGRDPGTYCCDTFKKISKNAGKTALRSYAMNPYFGCSLESLTVPGWVREIKMTELAAKGDAGRLLLFAEIPCFQFGTQTPALPSGQTACDSVLQTGIYKSSTGDEVIGPSGSEEAIGFNHRVGKRNVAHVVFADGHVETIAQPLRPSSSDMLKLTQAYCNGEEPDQDIVKKLH